MNLVKVKEFFLNNDNFCIVCHASPDGDTIGSSYGMYYALKQIGKKAKVICADSIPEKFFYLLENYSEYTFDNGVYVTMDTADIILLGDLKDELEGKVSLNIDHHLSNVPFAENMYLNSDSSSNCENVLDIILEMGITINEDIANCLYTGIITDTGCFKYENVNSRTHRCASILVECGAKSDFISYIHFDEITKEYIELEKLALNNMKYYKDDKICVMVVTVDDLQKTNATSTDVDVISAKPKRIKGVEIAVILKQKTDDLFKVSFRTSKNYKANEIAKCFNGGGHIRAAGCTIDGTLNEVISKILDVLDKYIKD